MPAVSSALTGNQASSPATAGVSQVTSQAAVVGPSQAQVSASANDQQTDGSIISNQATADFDLSTKVKLDLALEAIEEANKVQAEATQAVAQPVINQLASEEAPPTIGSMGGKERGVAVSPDAQMVDAGSSLAGVEYEPTPEMPPEVEEYVKRVEDHAEDLSEPIVVDGQQVSQVNHHHPTQPVVVLPISEEDEKKAKFKSPKYSIRWLVEWSHKIIKKFVGKVVYRVE